MGQGRVNTSCAPSCRPTSSPCHFYGPSTTLPPRQYACSTLEMRCPAAHPLTSTMLSDAVPVRVWHAIMYNTRPRYDYVRLRRNKMMRRYIRTLLCSMNFRQHTLHLPISDYQAFGGGQIKGPSFFAATNVSMTRHCTKAWNFRNNQHGDLALRHIATDFVALHACQKHGQRPSDHPR